MKPRTLGRYVLGPRVGAGGMGVVHEAHDPELQRRVALKLLRPSGRRDRTERLVREAQAQAQLSHDNVVPIYDVGVDRSDPDAPEIYIAMELVPGGTLREWSAQAHAWPEVLDRYIAAGRGLAAAHAAGIVHRDFKPANVLLGADGRPRVTDFGLALAGVDTASASGPQPVVEPRPGTGPQVVIQDARLTVTGEVMGTPQYMAPEQHVGRNVDARADQFAFCVALYEAIYDQRPFPGDDIGAIATRKLAGKLPPLTTARARQVPRSLHRILARGLRPDPAERWPHMTALLAALERVLRRRGGSRWGPMAIAAGTIAIAAVVLATRDRGACEDSDPSWAAAVRGELDAAFAATGLDRAGATATRVGDALDRHTARWTEARAQACEALAAAPRDQALVCLDGARAAVDAWVGGVVEGLADPERRDATLDGSIDAVLQLGDPTACVQLDPDATTDHGVAAADLEAELLGLARSSALRLAMQGSEALATIDPVLARARDLGARTLEARALLERGRVMTELGRFAEARDDYEQAYLAAVEIGEDPVAASAALMMAETLGRDLAQGEEAVRWLEHGAAAVERAGDPEQRANLWLTRTVVNLDRGAAAEAVESARHGVVEVAALFGEGDPRTATATSDLGLSLMNAGRLDEALVELERAQALMFAAYGEDHPAVVDVLVNLGLCHYRLTHHDVARKVLESAMKIRVAASGERHPQVAVIHGNLGIALTELGAYDESLAHHTQALALNTALYGENHPGPARAWMNIGMIHYRRGDDARARDAYEQALRRFEAALGPDHPEVARVLHNLGLLLRDTGAHEEGLARLRAGGALFLAEQGPDGDLVALSRLEVAATLVMAGKVDEGLAELDAVAPLLDAKFGADSYYAVMLWSYRAQGYTASGRIADARRELDRAIAVGTRLRSAEDPVVVEAVRARAALGK